MMHYWSKHCGHNFAMWPSGKSKCARRLRERGAIAFLSQCRPVKITWNKIAWRCDSKRQIQKQALHMGNYVIATTYPHGVLATVWGLPLIHNDALRPQILKHITFCTIFEQGHSFSINDNYAFISSKKLRSKILRLKIEKHQVWLRRFNVCFSGTLRKQPTTRTTQGSIGLPAAGRLATSPTDPHSALW